MKINILTVKILSEAPFFSMATSTNPRLTIPPNISWIVDSVPLALECFIKLRVNAVDSPF